MDSAATKSLERSKLIRVDSPRPAAFLSASIPIGHGLRGIEQASRFFLDGYQTDMRRPAIWGLSIFAIFALSGWRWRKVSYAVGHERFIVASMPKCDV